MSKCKKKNSNSFNVNGKRVSKEEALSHIENEDNVIQSLKIDFPNTEKSGNEEPTHDGFDIPLAIISGLSQKMTKVNAGTAKMSFYKSRDILSGLKSRASSRLAVGS